MKERRRLELAAVKVLWIFVLATGTALALQSVRPADPPSSTGFALGETCVALNLSVVAQLENGDLAEAEKILAGALAARAGRNRDLCAGLLLNNMAVVMSISGRFAEGEKLAIQSIRILEMAYPQADSVILRPLHTLASSRFELGKKAGARAAVKRIQAIRSDSVQDRALVHGITGTMFQADGKRRQAEVAYLSALSALKEAGRSESADCGKILCSLAKLYIEQRRFVEAREALGRAQGIFTRSKNSAWFDRIKFLRVQGELQAREDKWQEALQDLGDALRLASDNPRLGPASLIPIMTGYARALRKNHREQEARAIENRATELKKGLVANSVVDVADYLELKPAKE